MLFQKIKLLAAALCFGASALLGQVNFTESNLPILKINTGGANIPDEPKIPATLQLIANASGQLNHPTDPANAYDGHCGIELRGATSQGYEKKPYDIELRDAAGLSQAAEILGLPLESDFALIQPLNDKSLMRDVLAFRLAAQSMPWAPRTRYVEVVINGQYMGVYILLEKIKRGKNRVNIAKLKPTDLAGDSLTGGYILKMDKTNGGGFGGDWQSNFPPIAGSWQTTWFQLHYPKWANAAPEQQTYVHNWLDQFEQNMTAWQPNSPGTDYEQWLDADTWVNYLLVNELGKNIDAYRLSAYFYKDRDGKDGRLAMGPVWDFNIAFGMGDYCTGQLVSGWVKDFNEYCGGDSWVIHFWWEKICRDAQFQQRVGDRWRNLRQTVWSDQNLSATIDSFTVLLADPQLRNFQRWPVLGQYVWPNAFIGQTWELEVWYLKTWTLDRAHWMDGHIQSIGPLAAPDSYREEPAAETVRVFPNPTTAGQGLHLEFAEGVDVREASLLLFDSAGRQVFALKNLPAGGGAVPLPGLAAGTYFYQIQAAGRVLKRGTVEISH